LDKRIAIEPTGYIETKYDVRKGTPAQGRGAVNSRGSIIVRDEFVDGVGGLKEGDTITVVFLRS